MLMFSGTSAGGGRGQQINHFAFDLQFAYPPLKSQACNLLGLGAKVSQQVAEPYKEAFADTPGTSNAASWNNHGASNNLPTSTLPCDAVSSWKVRPQRSYFG